MSPAPKAGPRGDGIKAEPTGHDRSIASGGQGPTLRNVLENARSEHGCDLKDLTVFDTKADPYRLDTPKNHRVGAWAARQIARFFRPGQRIHIRGLHYAIVAKGNVRKPDGKIYRNTDPDWEWLAEEAMKAARWLGYVPFDRISDKRNAEPIIHRARASPEPTARNLYASRLDSANRGRPRRNLHHRAHGAAYRIRS